MLRIGVALFLLLVLIVLAVQIVLWTTLPKSIVLKQVEQSLGVHATAGEVSTGWLGATTLTHVTLSMPLATQSVVEVPALKVRHNWLTSLLLGRPLHIDYLEIQKPKVQVWQNPDGKWNVAEFVELFSRTSGKEAAKQNVQQASPAARPELPEIMLSDVTILVTDNTGRTVTIEPLTIHGTPESSLVWRYELAVPGHVALSGKVAPGGYWRHQVDIQVKNIRDWVAPWVPSAPAVEMTAHWTGDLESNAVVGRLAIEGLTANGYAARGALAVRSQGGAVTIRPENVIVGPALAHGQAPTQASAVQMATAAGEIRFDGANLIADQLKLVGLGGVARVDGQYAVAAGTASLSAVWEALKIPAMAQHNGSLKVNLTKRLDGGPDLRAELVTNGSLGGGSRTWDGRVDLRGGGKNWNETNWRLVTPAMMLKGRRTVSIAGLNAEVETQGNRVSLKSIRTDDSNPAYAGANPAQPAASGANRAEPRNLNGNGWLNGKDGTWAFRLDGQQWPLPFIGNEPMSFHLDMRGDAQRLSLDNLTLRVSDVLAKVTGDYDMSRPKPIGIDVVIEREPQPAAARLIGHARLEQSGQPAPLVSGNVAGKFHAEGKLDPLKLSIEGRLKADHLKIQDQPVGHVDLQIRGAGGDDAIVLKTQLGFIGGVWNLEADYVVDEETLTLVADFRDLDLAQVGPIIGQPGIAGAANGHARLYLPALSPDPALVRLDGQIDVIKLNAPPLAADTIKLPIRIADGKLTVAPLEAVAGKSGKFTTSLTADITQFGRLDIAEMKLSDWPASIPGEADVTLNASSKRISIDLPQASSSEPAAQKLRITSPALTIDSTVRLGPAKLLAGKLHTQVVMEGRTMDVPELKAELFGGTGSGRAIVDLDHPLLAAADLKIDGIDAARLIQIFPGLDGLSGRYAMTSRLSPVEPGAVPGALEPLVLDVNLKSEHAQYKKAELGDGHFRAFLNLDPHWGLVRAVLQDSPETSIPKDRSQGPPVNGIYVAHGLVKLWGRLVRYGDETGRAGMTSLSTHLRVGLQSISLNQLAHAVDPKADPMQGVIDGNILLWGKTGIQPTVTSQNLVLSSPTNPTIATPVPAGETPLLQRLIRSLYGQGTVKLTSANLADFSPVSGLYNGMHLGQDMSVPTGYGDVSFRIESNAMNITSMHYFNRGVEVRAIATVSDLMNMPNSPITGSAVGTVRPFKNIDLPLIADIDKLFQAIETSAVVEEIRGTVHKMEIQIIPFGDIGSTMREFLMGDIKAQVQGSAY